MSDDSSNVLPWPEKGLQKALEALGEAHGPAALASAFQSLQGRVKRLRRDSGHALGPLATAVREAIQIRDQMKAEGVTGEALNEGLEGVLRDLWPKGRAEAWRDLCPECRDYGLIMQTCPGDATCGRPKPHASHGYGRPCFCEHGRQFRDAPKPSPDDFTKAGKTPKKDFTRAGR